MRSLTRAGLAAACAAGVLAPVAPATATTGQVSERVYVETTLDTDGNGRPDRIAIDITRPDSTEKVPSVFVHSPYVNGGNQVANHSVDVDRLPQENLFGAQAADADGTLKTAVALSTQTLLANGYADIKGHSIGTGASEGCPTSGDRSETIGATAVVDWLNGRAKGYNSSGAQVTASWSTGAVGMTGASYDGTLANAAASTGVDGLKAIVPVVAISDWYEYYRANGLVVAPGGYQGEDADVLAKFVTRSGCANAISKITSAQDRVSGDRTQFWKDRTYLPDAGKVKAGVFVVSGQGDFNVKGTQYARWWDELTRLNVPRRIWLHKDGHGYPSRSDYNQAVLDWFDYFVKGTQNGVLDKPRAEVQRTDGTWEKFGDWPVPGARDTVYALGATSATAPGTLAAQSTGSTAQTFTDDGRAKKAATLAASPDSANPNRLVYRTDKLTASTRLTGVPKVTLRMAVENRADANVTALLVDYGPNGATIITRGWIDPQNRGASDRTERLTQGQEYDLTFALQPRDHVFAKDHRIGLVVISTDNEFTLRPSAGTKLRLAPAASALTLRLL